MMPRMNTAGCLFITAIACAQVPFPAANLQFEAASVKEVQPENVVPRRFTATPGRFRAQSVSIANTIAYAYSVQPAQIMGLNAGPGLYDVEGTTAASSTQAELRLMLQALLADRFQLKFHRELRDLPVDRLVVGKTLMLKPSQLAEADPRGYSLRASERGPRFLKAKATAISLDWLADILSGQLSRLVVDETGLNGLYEFEVDFEFDPAEAMDKTVPVHEASNHLREQMVSALGLRLQSGRKATVPVLIIDHVERPKPN